MWQQDVGSGERDEELLLAPLAWPVPSGWAAARRSGPLAPVANDDHEVMEAELRCKNKPLKLRPLDNDEPGDAPLDPRSLAIVDDPDHGTIEVRGKNLFYRPDAGFSGEDAFVYTVADRDGDVSNPATVRIEVEPVQPPTAVDDIYELSPKKPGTPFKLDVVKNDLPGTCKLDPKSIEIVDAPEHGTVQVKGRNLLYVPEPGYSGPDQFSYTVAGKDGSRSDPAVVSINVESAGGGTPPPDTCDDFPPLPVEVVYMNGGTHDAVLNTVMAGSAAAETVVVGSLRPGLYYLAGLGGNDTYRLDTLPIGGFVVVHDTSGTDRLSFPADWDPQSRAGISVVVADIAGDLVLVDAEAFTTVVVPFWQDGDHRIETWDLGTLGQHSYRQLVDLLRNGRGTYFFEFDSIGQALDEAGVPPEERAPVLELWQDYVALRNGVESCLGGGRAKLLLVDGDPGAGTDVGSGAPQMLAALVDQPETFVV